MQVLYAQTCSAFPVDKTVILSGSQRVEGASELLYAPVTVGGQSVLRGMLDTGSMSCTLSVDAENKLRDDNVLPRLQPVPSNVVFVGCGGRVTQPKCIYDLEIDIYGFKFTVPTFVVPGQRDELIVGSNVLRPVIQKMKSTDKYWELVSSHTSNPDCEQFLQLLSCISRWVGPEQPDVVGTVQLQQPITLLPQSEYLVWGKLPSTSSISPGSTVIVEPTSARSTPKNILVGRVVTPMWGDRWIPVKVLNPTQEAITLRRHAKIADVSTCLAVEDLPITQGLCGLQSNVSDLRTDITPPAGDPEQLLRDHGLADVDLNGCEVSESCKRRLVDLVLSYKDVFSRDKLECGEAKDFVHRIHLTDDRPFRLPYRRVPPAHYQQLREVLSDMEMKGIISQSLSEYASPLVMVWKKNGDLRICTDFRLLNAKTVKDAHPLPHQGDCLAALGGNALFSTMDLTSGFYNIPLHEADRRYTAFTTPMGLYEYNRLPQGLCNSPASFMRMMLSIFGDLNFSSLLCYLDDLLVFAPSEEEALKRLEVVFCRLRANNLKLSQKKCNFLRRSVKFLGHVVDASGVSVDEGKVSVISGFQKEDLMETDGCTPSQKKVRSFLGMVLYYQHFIPGCSSIAKPLFALTGGQIRKQKGSGGKTQRAGTFRKLTPQDWSPTCDRAFEDLKSALLHCVVLAHPDFDQPFILSTDASLDGIGAVLSQVPVGEDKARPVAFASKSLSRSQTRYPAHRLEFLALKWAVCEKFSHWLKGHKFTVWTDNNPLTYIMTKPRLDACEQRWVSKLSPYSFDIRHVPGRLNVVADALSRTPFVKPLCQRILSEPYSRLLEQVCTVEDSCVQDAFHVTCLPQSAESLSLCSPGGVDLSEEEVSSLLSSYDDWDSGPKQRAASLTGYLDQLIPPDQDMSSSLSLADLQSHQRQDPTIGRVLHYVERKRKPSRRERDRESQATLCVLKQWDKLTTQDGILYRVSRNPVTKHKRFQFVLPDSLKMKALAGVHDLAGHQGQPRTLSLVRQRFYWYDVEKDVRSYVRNCPRCVLSKTPEPAARAPLESITTSAPLELVCIDFWSAEDNNNKSVDVLVITDHFTKLAHAFPCQDQTAKKVAKKLWDNFFCVYGFPQRLHSDQGANFQSELVAELLEMAGVTQSRTTPYHPMGNGGTERFNRTLGGMLRSLPPRSKHKWPQMVQSMTFAYNCTQHETTGFAPFYLMFGRVPRLPVDLLFRNILHDETVCDYDTYVKSLATDLQTAMLQAQRHSTVERSHQASQYNKRAKGSSLSVGDRVLVANKGGRGKRKLADKWEPSVYTVVASKPQCHIYRIRDQHGQEKTVHRNLLLSVNFLPLDNLLLAEEDFPGVRTGPSNPGSMLDSEAAVSELDSVDGSLDHVASWVDDQLCSAEEEDESTLPVVSVPSSDAAPLPAPLPCIPGQIPGNDACSRYGRVVKPVRRLIESMVHIAQRFSVAPQCMILIF